MDVILLQLLNGLDKGGAYALIALGLTLIFGTLGVVNFAHGALFMIGAFCAVTVNRLLNIDIVKLDPKNTTPWGTPVEIRTPYVEEKIAAWTAAEPEFVRRAGFVLIARRAVKDKKAPDSAFLKYFPLIR